nr:GIY-YIG nuclease family protein [Litorivivens lipolytica]
MIRSASGKLYTGISTDVERRFQEHAGERPNGARFFRGDPPQEIVYREAVANRAEASRREAEIKKFNRSAKLKLIEHYQQDNSLG